MGIFYNENDEKVSYSLKKCNIINDGDIGLYGKVYSVGDDLCLKKIDYLGDINLDIIKLIRELKLKNFYEIYDLLFDKRGIFKGYTMKYYPKEDIDILTMPTSYTLDNLFNIYNSILRLTEKGVHASDMHDDNVILNSNYIIVIDVDLFEYSLYIPSDKLLKLNVNAVKSLFKKIYYRDINENYENYCFTYSYIIENLYKKINHVSGLEMFYRELEGYKYPIDYIKKLSKSK